MKTLNVMYRYIGAVGVGGEVYLYNVCENTPIRISPHNICPCKEQLSEAHLYPNVKTFKYINTF